MSMFTAHQRDVLLRRLAREICWQRATAFDHDTSTNLARHIVACLDETGFSAATSRRAIVKIVERMESAG